MAYHRYGTYNFCYSTSYIHLFLADDENFYPEGLSAFNAIADIVEIELFNPDACKE
jgi:hypothetical protein